jgi:mono/diheme cytochrome c family protein
MWPGTSELWVASLYNRVPSAKGVRHQMTHVHRFGSSYGLSIACVALLVCAATQSSSPQVYAQQTRNAKEGVYASAQAKRGEALYQERCAPCHGADLAGETGPPLAGESFLASWGKSPLFEVFDKIQKTMPADMPGTLMKPEVADLVAYILQANKFPPGTMELDNGEAALKQITLVSPATAAAPPAATQANLSFPVTGNLNQVMKGVLFPSSNVLFDVQTRDPGTRDKSADNSTIIGRYSNVYEPWIQVDAAAIAIAEAGPMLMMPGRRCENGKPVPVDRPDWQKYVQELVGVGRDAYKASQTRNQEAVSDITNQVSEACANCHRVYRDGRNAANRCTPR